MSATILCDEKYKQGDYVLYSDPKITSVVTDPNARGEGARLIYTTTPHLCIGVISQVFEPKKQSFASKTSNFFGFNRSNKASTRRETKLLRANEDKFKRRCTITELKCIPIAESKIVEEEKIPKPTIIYTLTQQDAALARAGQAEKVLKTIFSKGGKRRTRRARSKRATRKYKL